MAGSKAARVPNVWDTLRNQSNQINRDFALSRRVFNPQTIAIPPSPEIPPAGNSGSDSGNALQTAGGTMIGPIAYFPIALFIQDLEIGKPASETSRVLDISGPIGAASSRILANGGVGTTLLEFIKGGQYAGQQLNIQGIVTQNLTIKDDASGNGSAGLNIRTQTGGDLTLVGNANVLLVFDSTQNQWAVVSSIAGSAAVLSIGQLSDVSITPDPPTANDILQFNTTSGFWENQPSTAGGGLLVDLSNLQAGAVPPVDLSLNNFDLENVTEIRMNAAGNGLIDNVQTLDFFQFNHNIISVGDSMTIQVDAADSIILKTGSTEAAEIRSHGIDTLDIRFPTPQNITQNVYQILQANLTMTFNVPDTRGYSWNVNANSQMSLNASGTLNVTQLTAQQSVFLSENAGFVAVDGRLGTLGGDVIIGSGGNSVNITDLFDNVSGQFADDTFAIFNAAVPSKVATFSAASLSQTRVYSFQDVNGRLALLDGVQQDFTVSVGFTNNNLVDVGGIFTTSAPTDIGQLSNYFSDLYINQIFWFGDTSLEFKIAGNTANGFDFVVPAGREFDFFFDGTGTTPSWIIRDTVIDAQGGRLEDLEEIQFDGNNVIPSGSTVRRFGFNSARAQTNMPIGGGFDLLFGGEVEWFFSPTALTGDNFIANFSLNIVENSSTVSFGQIVRNGDDMFVNTTNGVKNFADIGTGGGAGGMNTDLSNMSSPTTPPVTLAMNNQDITQVRDLSFQTNGTSVIFMNSGDITMGGGDISAIGNLTMAASSSILNLLAGSITRSGNITFDNAFSVLNLNGSNITNVGRITADDGKFNDDLEIDGALNHDGSSLGFFGQPPQVRKFAALPASTSNNDLFIALFNIIQALGNLSGFGYGLVDSGQ